MRTVAMPPNHEVLIPGHGLVGTRELVLRHMEMGESAVYYNLEMEDCHSAWYGPARRCKACFEVSLQLIATLTV
jgi:hypothetical protein